MAIRDFALIRQFMTSQGAVALFDVPWVLFYVLLLFAFHPWFGVMAHSQRKHHELSASQYEFHSSHGHAASHSKRMAKNSKSAHPTPPHQTLVAQNSQSKSETVSTLGNRVKQNLVAVQVNIPLFNGFGTQAQTEKAAAALTQQRAELDIVQTDVLKEAFAAQKQLMVSSNFARAYAKAISAAEQQEKAIETGIGHQLNSTVELTNIQAKQTELKLKKLERELKANQAHFTLLKLTGELNVEQVANQIMWTTGLMPDAQ